MLFNIPFSNVLDVKHLVFKCKLKFFFLSVNLNFIWKYISSFLGNSVVRNPPANAADAGLIPGSGRSPGEGNGNPLQYSCLGRGACWATFYRVTRVGDDLATKQQTTYIDLL